MLAKCNKFSSRWSLRIHGFCADSIHPRNKHCSASFGITHILNVAGRYGATDHTASRCYYEISADDEEGYDIMQHQGAASAFIRRALAEGGRCLIHCQAGINRSGVLACAELMLHEQLPVIDAVLRCQKARGVLLSNHSFQEALVKLADKKGLLGDAPPELQRSAVAATRKPRKTAAEALKGL